MTTSKFRKTLSQNPSTFGGALVPSVPLTPVHRSPFQDDSTLPKGACAVPCLWEARSPYRSYVRTIRGSQMKLMPMSCIPALMPARGTRPSSSERWRLWRTSRAMTSGKSRPAQAKLDQCQCISLSGEFEGGLGSLNRPQTTLQGVIPSFCPVLCRLLLGSFTFFFSELQMSASNFKLIFYNQFPLVG